MKFIDMLTEHEYTLADLKEDYEELRAESPEDFPSTFKADFFEILMATINGRNDLKIIGPTPNETCNVITRLRSTIPGF